MSSLHQPLRKNSVLLYPGGNIVSRPVCDDAHRFFKFKTHLAAPDPLLERLDPGDVGQPTVDTVPLQSFSDRKDMQISSSDYKYNKSDSLLKLYPILKTPQKISKRSENKCKRGPLLVFFVREED